MAKVTLTTGPNFRRTVQKAGGWEGKLGRAIDASLARGAELGAAEVKRHAFGPGGQLTARSGGLQAAVRGQLKRPGLAVIGVPGESPAAPYAGIQEEGGTIRPRQRKWLTIPAEHALTRSGRGKKISARDFKDLVFIKVRETLALLVRDVKGRRKRTEVFFRLVKKVTIKPSRWLSRNVIDHAKPVMVRMLQKDLKAFFTKR